MPKRINNLEWFARKAYRERNVFLELVVHCDENIKKVYNSNLSDEIKEFVALDLIRKKEETIEMVKRIPNNEHFLALLNKIEGKKDDKKRRR